MLHRILASLTGPELKASISRHIQLHRAYHRHISPAIAVHLTASYVWAAGNAVMRLCGATEIEVNANPALST